MKKQLPKNWVEANLFDVANVITGKKDANHSTEEGDYTFFTCAFEPLRSPDYDFEDEVLILPGNGANVGHVFYFNGKFQAYQRTYIVEKIKINPKYLFYHFSAFWRIRNENEQFGTATNYIKIGNFKSYSISIAPLLEQHRIVAKLDTLFDQLETIKTSMANIPLLLKDFRQQVLTQAVNGKLTEEWRKGKELERTIDTTIGQLFEVKTGSTPKRGTSIYYDNATIPWLKSGQVRNEFIYEADEFITEIAVKDTNAKIYPVDSILVAMYGEGKTRGQVGWTKIEAASNQAIAALVNINMKLVTKKYVYNFCLSQYNEIRAQAEGGNQPNLNLSKIKNWKIKLPSDIEQQEIVSRVESLFAKADTIEQQYQAIKEKIDTLSQALLHKAFKGELTEQLDSDGDARKLLQQIQELKTSDVKPKKATAKKVKNYPENETVWGMVAEE